MTRLAELTEPRLIFPSVQGTDGPTVLREVAEKMAGAGVIADAGGLYQKLWEREQLGSTGIGGGVAIPHCKLQGLDEVVVSVALARQGVEFGAVDEEPVKLFFFVVSPDDAPAAHLQSLASISKWVKAGEHVGRILALDDEAAIYDLIEQESP